jgi:DNA mismatch repair protein MutL
MPAIHILPDRLVSQIAAGEVVERPASVVKELIENALDAGAGEIRIELEGGGKRRIRVLDDGCGMGRDDALLAFDRHATSKIDSFEDLERVGTLGFRGEALSSIAAVARVELLSATEPGAGTRVRLEGGRVRSAEPAARDRGTTVEVAALFFNVPARRKFLKSGRTELRRIVEVVQGYALARPGVRFSLRHDGRDLVQTVGGESGDPIAARHRIAQLFGDEFATHLTAIDAHGPSGGERVWGFVGDRETTRGRRLFTFVNRRLLRDRAILATFYRAVREEWRHDEFPALFLFLDLPAAGVDVNVHPQKAEVRFRDSAILGHVGAALRRALAEARGEEPAPLQPPSGSQFAPLAWRGSEGGPPSAGEVRESGAGSEAAMRLATATYLPLERAPIPLSGRSGAVRPFRLLGQYKGTLILLEGPDGLYVIDQHVAHERVLFERFRRDVMAERPPTQTLLEPLLLEVSRGERMRIQEMEAELARYGFELSELSGDMLGLTGIPASLSADEAEGLILRLGAEDPAAHAEESLQARLLEALAASRSCRAAVKMHEPLTAEEMEALVEELFQAEQPYACPHGRPIVLQMTDADLERRFERR